MSDKKTAIVTGGSGVIGSSIVRTLIDEFERVYILDITKPPLENNKITFIQTDLSVSEDIEAAIKKIDSRVDLLVLTAGVIRRGTIFDSSEEDFQYMFDNNVKANWLAMKFAAPKLGNHSTMIQIASGYVLEPVPDPGLYAITKATTSIMSDILALTRKDIRVKKVFPGPVLTPLLLEGRTKKQQEKVKKIAIEPSELATKIHKLLISDYSELQFVDASWDYKYI